MSRTPGSDRVPEPRLPKKRWPALPRVLFSLLGLGLAATAVAGVAGFYGYQELTMPGPLAATKVFEVAKGLGTPEIADALETAGIIADARVFAAATYLKRLRSGAQLKAGEYEFTAQMPMREVLALIESGKSITYKLSIPEGFTSAAALTRIAENDVLTGDVTAPPAEGAILPDTYVFKRGLSRQKMIDDMEQAEAKLVDSLWAARDPAIPLKSKEEAVILASIVEKETAKAGERPLIASVFMNRLINGMRLQSDPTIIYGITGGKGKLDRPLTKADITAPTPYNTYTIDGLPPGPIANPGRAALEAVMNPPVTTYLYFVADGSGGHAFASSLDEHNRNVQAWRKIDKQAATAMDTASDAPAPATAPQAPAANTLPDIAQADAAPADGSGLATGTVAPAPAAEAPAADAADMKTLNLKPGSVIRSGKRLIPVPRARPRT